ncbi:ABC transporter permease subunit [Proteiniclasticum sp. C24MP]|uniref:ABC transporter permease subunit n=1 Tax=Proteiniclasticum sp. C24MP TaxID=3374101 RepID=UPI003754B1F0
MKKINYPLLLGSLLFLFFMAAAMFPELFTDKDPMFEEPPRNMEVMVEGEVKDEFTMHPIWPSEDNLMGTDVAGRDIFARLVYGTRNTLRLGFYIALFRILLGMPIGMLAGMGKNFFRKLILFFNTYFSAVPILILSFLIFRMNFFRNLQIDRSILLYSVILAVLGWSRVAGIIEDAVKRIMEEDFIEGQIAIGKTWP